MSLEIWRRVLIILKLIIHVSCVSENTRFSCPRFQLITTLLLQLFKPFQNLAAKSASSCIVNTKSVSGGVGERRNIF